MSSVSRLFLVQVPTCFMDIDIFGDFFSPALLWDSSASVTLRCWRDGALIAVSESMLLLSDLFESKSSFRLAFLVNVVFATLLRLPSFKSCIMGSIFFMSLFTFCRVLLVTSSYASIFSSGSSMSCSSGFKIWDDKTVRLLPLLQLASRSLSSCSASTIPVSLSKNFEWAFMWPL